MNDRYTYRVSWSDDDGEYVGTCAEFPSLSHLDPDRIEALRGIQLLVDAVVVDMEKEGELIPVPLATRAYSGKFLTRVPPELHRQLVMMAAEEQISLNALVTTRLSASFLSQVRSARKPKTRQCA
jgi:predicted RNase H-like HicB family nuclease